ncbi:MAG: amidohydrolase, partial [Rhodothermales bacterium]|nr:amidohydrolase [Rhodothermales bacterium]
MKRLTLFSVLALAPLLAYAQADFVLHNARIYTVDEAQPMAQALAVRGERILMVGSDAQVLGAYPEAERRDAGGRAVIPGLIDAHAHLMGQGVAMLQVDLVGTGSVGEIIERMRDFEQTLPAGAWLTGRGWDQNDWPAAADGTHPFPTRQDLDAAFPDRPVWLRRIDGHAAWANTAALRAVGLEVLAGMDDPEGGQIIRDAQGQPTGVFIDTAMGYVGSKAPGFTDAQYAQALQLAIGEAVRLGLTGVHDAGIDRAEVELYQQAIDAGRFDLRLYGMIGGAGATFDHFCREGLIYDYGGKLTVRSVKLYMDGALGSRGAALLAPYSDDPGNVGLLREPPETFEQKVRRALACGLQINTHAIGDRGNRVVLDAYEAGFRDLGRGPGRHRIEHAQIVALEDIPRFADLGLIASMQPTHATSDMYWAEDRVGAERARGAYAWRALLDAGARLAFGSDFPVE